MQEVLRDDHPLVNVPHPRARKWALSRENVIVFVGLVLIMALGAYFRFQSTNWDDYVHFHPDERFTAGKVAAGMGGNWLVFTDGQIEEQREYCMAAYPATGGVGPFFDARCSSWNPHNIDAGHYAYGTLPPFVARLTADLLNNINGTNQYTSYDWLPLVWRTLSAIYDTITILLVFLTALTVHNRWSALVAAALYACAVLPIQIAHYATADAMSAMWTMFTVYFAMRAYKQGGWLNFALAGIGLGATVASRANLAPLVLTIIVAAGLRMMPMFDERLPWSERKRAFVNNFALLVLAGITTVLVLRVANPYTFQGPGFFGVSLNQRWFEDLRQAQYETSPANDAPPQWQWIGRMRYQFAFHNMVVWGMGVALGLTAWIAWGVAAWRWIRRKPSITALIPLVLWVGVYFGWVGGNFVMSMRYYLPLYGTLSVLAAWLLVSMVQGAMKRGGTVKRVLAWGALVGTVSFTLLWALMFTNIYRNLATFTQASYWLWENSPGDFYMRVDEREDLPLVNIPLANTIGVRNNLLSNATHLFLNAPVTVTFYPPESGNLSTIYAPRIGSLTPDQGAASLRFTISAPGESAPLAEAILTDTFPYDPITAGQPYEIPLDRPVYVAKAQPYTFTVEVISGATVATTGAVWTWEGEWDEAVPVQVCALPPGVRYTEIHQGYFSPEECRRLNASANLVTTQQLDIVHEDDERKRDTIQRVLDGTDYLIIGTNRRYDSNTRNLLRWPMSSAYYDALFSGELGFELVAMFQETFELGPLKVSDQYLPIYDAPRWLNEFEAEEAFHVYDHPVVFIYKKTDAYSSAKTAAILGGVSLNRPPSCGSYNCFDDPRTIGVVTWGTDRASVNPTQIMFTDDMLQTQTEGGTWSDRFDRDSLINSDSIMTVILWWLGIVGLGIVIAPYLFVAFPALTDRGYGLAKITAMLIIGWIGWLAASLRVPLWSGQGLWLITGLLGVGAAFIVFKQRARILDYVKEHWRLLVMIEIIGALMYGAFIIVRMTNPDLWTVGFGGEKPMDFAYFNGVLRSTIFPPIDPWHAGGYMNYYYFGFVVVGVPVLMFGVVPSIAYNLILPTLFSALGVGAFSVAYSLVSRWTTRADNPAMRRPFGNPLLAGVAALMLVTVLGNLDTPRVLFRGLADLGGYNGDTADMRNFLIEDYQRSTGQFPDETVMNDILRRGDNPRLMDRIRYQLDHTPEFVGAMFSGLSLWLQNSDVYRLPINSDRWFWAPSRTITESVGGGAITEMPIFTFIYGDLHAHMISMPLMVLAVAFVFNEIALAGREQRRIGARTLALFIGALTCGMFIATNSWEYPTFMLFGVLGLGYGWWLTWREFSRRSLWSMLLTIGGFIVIAWAVALPYTRWYASAYTSVRAWEDAKTPLWAYFNIHGLFLFLTVSLLLWETARWMRSVKVRTLRGKRDLLLFSLLIVIGVIGLSLYLANRGVIIALVVLPLLAWIALLFFRPNQNIPMQFVLVINGLALAITLGVDLVVLEGDIARQNTVFKFYMQVWILFSIAGGAAFAWLFDHIERWPIFNRIVWVSIGSLMLFAAVLFPIMGVPAKAVYRLSDDTPPTLDGAKFIAYASYFENDAMVDMQADADAIRWLQDNVQGTPAIIEGHSAGEYRWGGRVSIQTGLPAVLGWNFHQRQQRGLEPLTELVWQRMANVNNFYRTPDINTAWEILKHYNVKYIVVAGLERALYELSGGLTKFPIMVESGLLSVAYDSGAGAIIYEVNLDAAPRSLAARSTNGTGQ